MEALIAFIIMGVVVLTLIEVNERIKAKKQPPTSTPSPEEKEKEPCDTKTDREDCSACELIDVCEKKAEN